MAKCIKRSRNFGILPHLGDHNYDYFYNISILNNNITNIHIYVYVLLTHIFNLIHLLGEFVIQDGRPTHDGEDFHDVIGEPLGAETTKSKTILTK